MHTIARIAVALALLTLSLQSPVLAQCRQQATFLPYGEFRKDWDWGQIYPHHPPLVVGDEIRFYYTGITGRHWHTYHKDTRDSGIGLATLRLDGFVSVNAGEEPGIRYNHYLQSYD